MELRKKYFADERKDDLHELGQSLQRSDVPNHVTGRTVYFADRHFPNMLYLKMVRSPHHRCGASSRGLPGQGLRRRRGPDEPGRCPEDDGPLAGRGDAWPPPWAGLCVACEPAGEREAPGWPGLPPGER